MCTSAINKDYILCIEENDNGLSLRREYIDCSSKDLIRSLESKINNKEYSVYQLENELYSSLPQSMTTGYNYLYPYGYDESYVEGVYPGVFIANINKEASDHSGREYASDLKQRFVDQVKRYIYAMDYQRTMNALSMRNEVKMYSLEMMGWNEFNFNINDDIKAIVRTNFGYGSSSYFTLKLQYKGIDIIPYTHIVNYYYAHMIELIRCTQNYSPSRDNWETAMGYIADAANISSDPTSFIQKYIVGECKTMIEKLKELNKDARCFCENLMQREHNGNDLLYVVDADNYNKEVFSIYPDEFSFTKRCEKTSGALNFLENMRFRTEYFPEFQNFIDELIEMNLNLIPEIDERAQIIEDEIQISERKKQVQKNELDKVDGMIAPHKEEINKIVEQRKKEKGVVDGVTLILLSRNVEEEYLNNHSDYKDLCNNRSNISKEISCINLDIDRRKNFIKKMLECKSLIQEKALPNVA